MEEEGVMKWLTEEKLKLERKYNVRVSICAFDLAVVYGLKSFDFKLISGDASPKRVVKLLVRASKLVLKKFRNCAYENKFYRKAYELRRALVELIELYRDSPQDSHSWLTRVKWERDSASIFMNDFLQKWEHVLTSRGGDGILIPECAEKCNFFKDYAPIIADLYCNMPSVSSLHLSRKRIKREDELTTMPKLVAGEIGQFLDDIQGQLIECFRCLLTVKACHVAEVVSRLTDVPLTQILPSTCHLKEKGKYKTKQRVVNQEHVIDEIFEIVGCQERMTTRPMGSFLLLGPPGVGKTEIAKAVAKHWYCDVSRLLKIDMSEYAEPKLESASCDLSEWANEKHQNLWNRLTEAVGRRPYSVILLDKIDKAAASVTGILLEVLNNNAPSDIEGKHVDFSKSIIFMTSSVGTNQLELTCTCFDENVYTWCKFSHNPREFYKTHNCALTGSGCERVVREARKFFSSDLLDSFDKVIVVEKFRNRKAVARLLLREIVGEVAGRRIIVHASNAALDVLLGKASTKSVGAGMAIDKSLREHVIPQVLAAEGSNSVVCVDTLFETRELSFRFQTHKVSMEDWYFKQKDGTFGECIANLRMKVESAYNIFNLRRECLPLLVCSGQMLGQSLLSICNSILLFSPFPNPPPKSAFEEHTHMLMQEPLCDEAPNGLLTVEEKEKIENQWISLQENITGVAKATSVILDAILKIIAAPFQLPDSPARHYLFLGLDDDARMGLINGLTESLRSSSAKSLFTHVKLDNNCSGEIQRKLLIEEVKEKPCMVLLFDGVEFSDDVLYRSLLEIFDDGTLSDGEGLTVDFQKTIVILASAAVNKRAMAKLFNYLEPCVLRSMGGNQIVKRFRTELLHRVDEIIYFDPLLPAHGDIIRHRKRDGRCMKQPHKVSVFRRLVREFEA